MTRIIKFKPITEFHGFAFEKPVPAKKLLPEWYKNSPRRTYGDTVDGIAKDGAVVSNLSIKGCMPFLDSLTTGYMFVTPADVEVRLDENGEFYFKWLVSYSPIGFHSEEQKAGIPRISEHEFGLPKWHSGWIINTPKGYSTLFTHPLNRNDLPFRTFSGVVETDRHDIEVNFPFQMLEQKEYPFIIPAGTPIAQIFPFKRTDWISIEQKGDEENYRKSFDKLKATIINRYRDYTWIAKKYN